MYGYTQAKALIYSKYGEPKDVLKYAQLHAKLNSPGTDSSPGSTSTRSRLRMARK
jgi:hypothetical protein